MKISSKRNVRIMVLLAAAVYFTSYVTRLNYGAAKVSIIDALGFTGAQGGLVETMLFIFYGGGQIVSGILSDRFLPERVLLSGILLSAVCNLVLPFAATVAGMCAVWAVNGFAQSLFWPPLVKIITRDLPEKNYVGAVRVVAVAAQVANIFVFCYVSLCLRFFNWESVFFVASGIAVVAAVGWTLGASLVKRSERRLLGGVRDLSAETPSAAETLSAETPTAAETPFEEIPSAAEKIPEKVSDGPTANGAASPLETPPQGRGKAKKRDMGAKKEHLLLSAFLTSGMIPILLVIALQGILRDGVTSWIPNLLKENFHLSDSTSVLITVALPVFSIAMLYLAMGLFGRLFRSNEIFEAVAFWSIASAVAVALFFSWNKSAVCAVVFSSILTGSMHSVNVALVSLIPARFSDTGKVSTATGIINAFTYVGSAISTYGFGWISGRFGWNTVIGSWLAVAAIGLCVSLAVLRRWTRFIRSKRLAAEGAGEAPASADGAAREGGEETEK